MRSVSAFRSRLLGQAALVVVLAGMSASCSNSLRLGEGPEFTGSTENQREILGYNSVDGQQGSGGGNAYQPAPAPSNAVTSSNLPPPPSSTYASAEPEPQPAPAPAPLADAAPMGGTFVWTAVGGRVISLKAGDSLAGLETKFGVPGEQILAANQLSSEGQLRPGKIIVIPRHVMVAPGETAPPAIASVAPAQEPATAAPAMRPTMTAAAGGGYTVQPGDTLFSVARKNGTTVAALARLNGLETTASLTTGEKLRISGEAPAAVAAAEPKTEPKLLGAPPKVLGTLTMKGTSPTPGTETEVASAAPAPASAPKIRLASPADTAETGSQFAANTPAASAQAMPTIPVAPQASDTPVTQNASINPADGAVDAPSADGKQFRWPVRGRIISGFGTKPNGEKNDGINLAVPAGTSVKSIEAGTVIYAGNELAGYGNLVLIRHAGGWVSAYAHNQDLLVKKGDTVQRGETIAHAGMTGSVASPQVHFELRQGAKPVNPLDYLAGA